jgi:hypothetical protein
LIVDTRIFGEAISLVKVRLKNFSMENKERSKNCSRGQVLLLLSLTYGVASSTVKRHLFSEPKLVTFFFFLQNKDFLVILVLHDRV